MLRNLLIALMLVASAPAFADRVAGERFEYTAQAKQVRYVHHAQRVRDGVCFGPSKLSRSWNDVIEYGDTNVLFFINDFSADADCKLKVARGAPFFEFTLAPERWAEVQARVREMAVCLSGRSCGWCDAKCARFSLPGRLVGSIDARGQDGFQVALWNANFSKQMIVEFDAASNAPSGVRYLTP